MMGFYLTNKGFLLKTYSILELMKDTTKEKISNSMKGNQNRVGKKQSYTSKAAIKESNKGYRWFNNGIKEVKAKVCPEGFSAGRLTKGIWVHQDGKEFLVKEIKPGMEKGRIWSTKGYKWYHTYKRNFLRKEYPLKEIQNFKLVEKMKDRPTGRTLNRLK